ncbi:MAG: S9 family peptidase [Chloroflexi bacterium]|nr:MAG: S9 family peptidase [Chloroflexota bacterium]
MPNKVVPFGSWASPISADLIATKSVEFFQPEIDREDIYWLEMRPEEAGRYVLVRRTRDGRMTDLTPQPFNVRTRVHEYGGGSYIVKDGVIYFSNYEDQRLYRLVPGEDAMPITPESGGTLRFADGIIDTNRKLIFCVREDHNQKKEPENTLVVIRTGEDAGEDSGRVIVSGSNFYSNPRLSPDGSKICWLSWNHPNMPWDGTELWVGNLDEAGNVIHARLAAGGSDESIFQPSWSPDGTLYYVSDLTGWWNLYRQKNGREEALSPMEAEFGRPQWVFGTSTYAFESPGRLFCTYQKEGKSHLASLDTETLYLDPIETGFEEISDLRASPGQLVFHAGSPDQPWSMVRLDTETGFPEILRASREVDIDQAYFSIPVMIDFPTENDLTAYGRYYRPRNPDFTPPPGEKPPLVVLSHGGPTSTTHTTFRLDIFYLTSRGIAVLDVDYGGSSGYGRDYRRRLNGAWGVVDVDDCVNGALYLVEQGEVDKERMAIKGGSAGGYTTLCALTFRDVFKAGASHYGIGDLESVAGDTHKFESRYMDTLVGPYPQFKDTYHERSPIHFTDRLSCSLILFQGLEDRIVPPSQSETMYRAVLEKGLPVSYIPFEGEQHGFRKSENIKRSLEAELYFYSKVFGFDLADEIDPCEIMNLK